MKKIETSHGIGEIEKIFVSELGFLMLRVKFGSIFKTYNLGKFNNVIEDNFKLLDG